MLSSNNLKGLLKRLLSNLIQKLVLKNSYDQRILLQCIGKYSLLINNKKWNKNIQFSSNGLKHCNITNIKTIVFKHYCLSAIVILLESAKYCVVLCTKIFIFFHKRKSNKLVILTHLNMKILGHGSAGLGLGILSVLHLDGTLINHYLD